MIRYNNEEVDKRKYWNLWEQSTQLWEIQTFQRHSSSKDLYLGLLLVLLFSLIYLKVPLVSLYLLMAKEQWINKKGF